MTLSMQAPNRRWHFRKIFSAERQLQMQGALLGLLLPTLHRCPFPLNGTPQIYPVRLRSCRTCQLRRCCGFSPSNTVASCACLTAHLANPQCRCTRARFFHAWRSTADVVKELIAVFTGSDCAQASRNMRRQRICARASLVCSLLLRVHSCYDCRAHVLHPRQFKYYAKDFGDNESERVATLIRLMGDRGDALRKVVTSCSIPPVIRASFTCCSVGGKCRFQDESRDSARRSRHAALPHGRSAINKVPQPASLLCSFMSSISSLLLFCLP